MDFPTIKVSNEPPPNWDVLQTKFGVEWDNTAVAYGDTMHFAHEPTDDVVEHELMHLMQQGYTTHGAEIWWKKYLSDPKFRYEQELQAYRMQFAYLSRQLKDRNQLAKRTARLAEDLSGDMYGKVCTFSQAFKQIRG